MTHLLLSLALPGRRNMLKSDATRAWQVKFAPTQESSAQEDQNEVSSVQESLFYKIRTALALAEIAHTRWTPHGLVC